MIRAASWITDAAPWGVAAIAAAGTYIAGRMQVRAARESPVTVAEGYGALVGDLRADLDRTRTELTRLVDELAECNARHHASDLRIADLETVVATLKAGG